MTKRPRRPSRSHRNKGPLGVDLALALGLELRDAFHHNCAYYVEVEESGAGYCLDGVSNDTGDLFVIGQALRGDVLTPEELQSVKDTIAANGGTQDMSPVPPTS